jgi:hypothetical protein
MCTQNYDLILLLSVSNYENLHLHFISRIHDEYFHVEKN